MRCALCHQRNIWETYSIALGLNSPFTAQEDTQSCDSDSTYCQDDSPLLRSGLPWQHSFDHQDFLLRLWKVWHLQSSVYKGWSMSSWSQPSPILDQVVLSRNMIKYIFEKYCLYTWSKEYKLKDKETNCKKVS